MSIGTRSVLLGAHQFLLHPLILACAWWRLYGFPWDPRLWICFFVHDLGYWGKSNMDGPEGERHVHWGANVMGIFDDRQLNFVMLGDRVIRFNWLARTCDRLFGHLMSKPWHTDNGADQSWFCLSFYHSRFIAKTYNVEPSLLCYADKLAICYHPKWLYLLQTWLTGELREYMSKEHHGANGKYNTMGIDTRSASAFYDSMHDHLLSWVNLNRPAMSKRGTVGT